MTRISGFLGKWFATPSLSEQLRALHVRDDIIQASESSAFARHSDRDLPALERVLTADEVVLQLLEGRHRSMMGLLVLTSSRVVFAPSGGRATPGVVMRAEIASAEWRMRRGLGVVMLTAPPDEFVVDQILGKQAEWFVGRLRENAADDLTGQQRMRRDPLEELAELRALHRAGVIEEPEYERRKSALFRQI